MDYLRHRCVEQKYIDHLIGSEKKEDELDDKIEETKKNLDEAKEELNKKKEELY